MLTPAQIRVALAAGALVVAFGGGWTVNGWRLTSAHDAERLQAAENAAESLRLAQQSVDAMAARLRASDDAHAAKLRKAQDETNRLRSAGSSVRLLVNASCPDMPQAASAPGVDSGTRAELDPAARPAYFALRDAIDRAEAQLAACQAELIERAR